MVVFIIERLDDGTIEPSSSRCEGHWKPKGLWRRYEDKGWLERQELINRDLHEWRLPNPFDEWWPKHFKITELK